MSVQCARVQGWSSTSGRVGLHKPAYLAKSMILRSKRLSDLQEEYVRLSPTSHIFSVRNSPVRATLCSAKCGDAILSYSQVSGTLGNLSTGPSEFIVFGLVLKGRAKTYSDSGEVQLSAGDGQLFLPGDKVIHVLENCYSFTLRMQTASDMTIWLKARPFKAVKDIVRVLESEDAQDLIRLIEFFSLEHDRSIGKPEESEQIETIGAAVVQRATKELQKICGYAGGYDPPLLNICLDVDSAIQNHSEKPLSAPEMAERAKCSIRQLYRAFDSIGAVTPIDYQMRVRLTRVRSEVASPRDVRMPLSTIAVRAGFGSVTKLKRSYYDEFGEFPEETAERRDRLLARVLSS